MHILLVIPAKNEASTLWITIPKLFDTLYSNEAKDLKWKVIVADNGSSDDTQSVVKQLQLQHSDLHYWHTEFAGRGSALKTVWSITEADAYAYIDADLDIDSNILFSEIAALKNGASIAIAVKTIDNSRPLYRNILSKTYTLLIKLFFPNLAIIDPQCGCKMMTKEAVLRLLPLCAETGWFLDTELLVYASRMGYCIEQLPAHVVTNRYASRKSKVRIMRDGLKLIHSLWNIKQREKKLIGTSDHTGARSKHNDIRTNI